MAQIATTTTVGVPLAFEKPWPTRASRSDLTRNMGKPRRGIKGYVGEKVLALPTYPIFRPISLSGSWTYYIMNSGQNRQQSGGQERYSVKKGAKVALEELVKRCQDVVPHEFRQYQSKVIFTSSSNDRVFFPCPLKEQDAIAAIKALEACAAAAILDIRWNKRSEGREIKVELNGSTCFLMSAYLTTVGGMDKADPNYKTKVEDTDLYGAQSTLYRRLSANLYKTKDDRYYHTHGSLEATAVLEGLGLKSHDPELKEYGECKATIGAAVRKLSVNELEERNTKAKGAGIEAITWAKFQESEHGKVLCTEPPFSLDRFPPNTMENPSTGAFSFAEFKTHKEAQAFDKHNDHDHRVLSGIKVLEMCRVIAGPTIGRSLAAHGASVMKVTSRLLPDVPFFQVDVNTGKHTVSLDLKNEQNREVFRRLLEEADVIIDGYRHGALDGLGYGPEALNKIAKERGYGFVYVAEDCFGGIGTGSEWAGRRGWQQIADCATGVAWAQGKFMGLDEPVIPPFPMSDYGTGALGCVAAMAGLYKRATQGGTWVCRTSLCQYDVFLMGLGELPEEEQDCLRAEHSQNDFFDLRHDDSVDEVGKRALKSMRLNTPHLFDKSLLREASSRHFKGATVVWPREAIEVTGAIIGHVRPARDNGVDEPTWDDWEVDEEMAKEIGLFKGHPEYC